MRPTRTALFCFLALGLVLAGPLMHVLPGKALAAAQPAAAAITGASASTSSQAGSGKNCPRGAINWSVCGDLTFLPTATDLNGQMGTIMANTGHTMPGDGLRESRIFRPPRSL